MQHLESLPHARQNLLDYNTVCKRLDCCKQTFHNLADTGKLGPVYRVGTGKRITERGLEEYLKSVCDVEAPDPIAPRAKRERKQAKQKKPRKNTSTDSTRGAR